MKKCTIGWFSRIVAFVVIVFFFVPLTGLFVYLAFFAPQTAQEERRQFAIGAVVFGGLVIFAVYRVVYRGLVWAEYDAETVIFHFSRQEAYAFRWEEIPGEQIQVGPHNGGYIFCIEADGRRRDIPLNYLCRGWRDFKKTLRQTGVLRRSGVLTDEEFRQEAQQILEGFGAYRAAHPGAVRPRPAGACAICPECGGQGVHIRKLPVIHLQVGKVCKTCGGSGYVAE